jgi:hypothetical protein
MHAHASRWGGIPKTGESGYLSRKGIYYLLVFLRAENILPSSLSSKHGVPVYRLARHDTDELVMALRNISCCTVRTLNRRSSDPKG